MLACLRPFHGRRSMVQQNRSTRRRRRLRFAFYRQIDVLLPLRIDPQGEQCNAFRALSLAVQSLRGTSCAGLAECACRLDIPPQGDPDAYARSKCKGDPLATTAYSGGQCPALP
ncbi:hypothetical protein MRX96_039980 [Rhipicephalus microplus]